ncbi:glycosyltransferase [Algicella marina]|nr:glycosyltransferase [Algicella marina]
MLKANRGERGGLVITRKYMEGAAEFAKTWPGPVTSLFEVSPTRTTDLDHIEVTPDEMGTGIEERPGNLDALADRVRNSAGALTYLCREEGPTAKMFHRIGVPLVFTSEYSHRTERQIINATTANPILRIRRKHWMWNAQRSCRASLRISAGLQCSGTPTYRQFHNIKPDALLFFDNRVRTTDVISEVNLERKAGVLAAKRPLRLVFGGRLISMKGVRYLPLVAEALRRRHIPFTMEIYGNGPLEQKLRNDIATRELGGCVMLRGALDFRTGWTAALRDGADLFVCCHPQGDPSSTYPEVMSCGVPIVGFGNEAFEGVVDTSGSGFVTPLGDVEALAARIAQLHSDRNALIEAARVARGFALENSFEVTFRRRMEHMIACSRLA